MNLQGIRLGPSLVFENHYNFDSSILIPKAEQLAADTPGFDSLFRYSLEIGNAGSTAVGQHAPNRAVLGGRQPHLWPELKEFTRWVFPVVSKILNEWDFRYDDLYIANSWVNRHRKGGFTNWHVHNNIDVTMAAYLNAPLNSGNLIMADPLENVWCNNPNIERKIYKTGGYIIPVQTNKIYFFPGWLRHSTEPSDSDEDRWVLTVNFKTTRGKQR